MTKIQAIFKTAIDLIGADKVSELLRSFGCNEEPTAEVCMEVLNREGKAFSVPFGEMLQAAAKTPKAKAIMRKAAKMSKASGTTGIDDAKATIALQYIQSIGGLLGKGVENVDDIINATNGTNSTLAYAQLLEAQRRQQEASQKSTLYWILGGIGILVVVMIFVIALSKRS